MRPRSLWAPAFAACAVFLAGAVHARASLQPPVATARPTVAGIAGVGKQLTAQSGTWAATGAIAYAYQWYRCDENGAACLSIHGAVASRYTVVARDAAHTLGLTVTATGPTGNTGAAYASLVGPIAPAKALLESTTQPAISGSAIVGKTIQVATGSWSPTPAKLSYAWQRCNPNGRICTAIAAETGNSYTIAPADVDHALVAVVQGTFGATTQSTLSASTAVVTAADAIGPTETAAPSLTGTEEQGEQLEISPGVWSGAGAVEYAYQWYRCDQEGSHCNSVHGATGATYRLTARDAGKTVGVTEHATDTTGTAVVYTSLVGPIAAGGSALAAIAQPEITGEPKAGALLRVSGGSWTATPTSAAYVWLRCNENGRICVPIPGATAPTYTPTIADADHRLVAAVTASVAKGSTSALSRATVPVT